MTKYFVMSDIHSFFTQFKKALDEKGWEQDNPNHVLVVCGDLFDRGPDAVKLFNFVKNLGDRFIYIRGNHEDLLERCVDEICSGLNVGAHHYSNGTVDTIMQFTGLTLHDIVIRRTLQTESIVRAKMQPVLDFIQDKSINYYEIGDYVCVHGWIPVICDDPIIYHARKKMRFDPDWNKLPIKDLSHEIIKYNAKWEEARWINGMEAWKQDVKIPNKTIICGHWHSSWGWSHIRQKRKEWPQKNQKDWEKSFEPFEDEGIIAIDACTGYSGICNCIVIEI